jgi:rhizosphere induced protein
MSTQYSLTVTNNSTQFQDIVVYQKAVDLGVPNALSLAWLTAPAHPGTTVTFTWDLNYNFVWSQTGTLRPGVTFQAAQTLPADPENPELNQIQFGYPRNAFTFVDGSAMGTPQLGSLYIRTLPDVPAETASVGIGMSNSGTFVVEAGPNLNSVFTPHPSYWVAAGTFTPGQVLDVEEMTNEQEVVYESTFSQEIVLGSNNLWASAA